MIGELGDSKYFFRDCSALLIKHLVAEKKDEQACEMLAQTAEMVDLREHWFNQFPRSLVSKALSKSVLDNDSKEDKQP